MPIYLDNKAVGGTVGLARHLYLVFTPAGSKNDYLQSQERLPRASLSFLASDYTTFLIVALFCVFLPVRSWGQSAVVEEQSCHPRLEGEFLSVLRDATARSDFRPLREAFGKNLSELVGQTCDSDTMRSILEEAGWEQVSITQLSDGATSIVGRKSSTRWWCKLMNCRPVAFGRVELTDGKVSVLSFSPGN